MWEGPLHLWVWRLTTTIRRLLYPSPVDAIGHCLKKLITALCKAVSIPMEKTSSALPKADAVPAHGVPYKDIIGSLLYSFMCSRPDIPYAVSTLAQYCKAPTKVRRTPTKRLFRYLKGTQYTELVYIRGGTPDELGCFIGYANVDWARLPCRKSTIAFALFYDKCLLSRKVASIASWRYQQQSLKN